MILNLVFFKKIRSKIKFVQMIGRGTRLCENMFENRTIDVWAYNLETVVAKKLETIIARTTTNTRMRDFYDLHILALLYGNQISKDVLGQALAVTAEKRGSARLMSDAETVLCDMVHYRNLHRRH